MECRGLNARESGVRSDGHSENSTGCCAASLPWITGLRLRISSSVLKVAEFRPSLH